MKVDLVKNNELSKELKNEHGFELGSCYVNADRLFRDKVCKYNVIGFARKKGSEIAFRHAWNYTEDFKQLIDATLDDDINNYEYFQSYCLDLDTFYKHRVVFNCDGNDYKYYNRFEEIECAVTDKLKLCNYDLYGYLYEEGTEKFGYDCFDEDSSINLRANLL